MRRLMVAASLALALSVSVAAVSYAKFEQITVAAASLGFTAANINNTTGAHPSATSAYCRLRTAQISYTVDGTTPTASVGSLWEIGEEKQFTGNDTLNNFRAIRTGASSGQLDCTYFGAY